jgi:NAD(P)-dependent dehydrogenase (short-subunit alcohol dehydrogenase family)
MADLSRMADVETLAKAVTEKHPKLDVLINNAGVYSAPDPVTQDGLDVRFAVNTIAPYLLTRRLLLLKIRGCFFKAEESHRLNCVWALSVAQHSESSIKWDQYPFQ